jgi:hypothetical protein
MVILEWGRVSSSFAKAAARDSMVSPITPVRRFRGCRVGAKLVRKLLLRFDFYHFAPLIVTALGAGAMRHFALVAVGALAQRVAGKEVVGAPL